MWGEIDPALRANLKFSNFQVELLEPGWVPSSCFNDYVTPGLKGKDFTVWKVTYEDCEEPTIICYHKDSPANLGQVFFVSTPLSLVCSKTCRLTPSTTSLSLRSQAACVNGWATSSPSPT